MKEIINYWLYHWIDRYIGIPLCFLFYPLSKLLQKKSINYRNILAIKLSMMGDTILLVPSLRALREKFNNAYISIICSKVNIEILRDCPYIDETVVVEFTKLINPVYLLKIINKLRKNKFDLVIDFEQWFRISTLISFFSFAKERIGFKTKGQYKHLLFTKTIPHVKNRHEVECFLDLLRPLDIETSNKNLELWPKESNIREVNMILESMKINSDFIVLHTEVSVRARLRQWPIENFAELGNKFIRKYNFEILIASTQRNKYHTERLNYLLEKKAHLLIDVPLLTLYVLLSKAKLVIANNTGFMHLAASAGAKVVCLHGPVSPVKWGPWGKGHVSIKSNLPCSPCVYLGFEYGCRINKCMREIKPEEVFYLIDTF